METPNKYANAKIYKIVDNAYTECYIGSTIQHLSSRMSKHRSKYKSFNEGNHHFVSVFALFELYGVDNCKIELIEDFPCENKEQLLKREGYYIRQEECINKFIAGRTINEWKEDNRERVLAIQKTFRDKNKDKINEKKREHRQSHSELIKSHDKAYYEANKERIKETQTRYREKTKEHIAEKGKTYYKDNIDKIRLYHYNHGRVRVECSICHKEYSRASLTKHKHRMHPEEH